jgi:hypothetical protein
MPKKKNMFMQIYLHTHTHTTSGLHDLVWRGYVDLYSGFCHVENSGLSKTGMLLFWKGNRFCVCICFSQNTCQVAVADWLLLGEANPRSNGLVRGVQRFVTTIQQWL